MLNAGKISIARKYLNLSKVFDEEIEGNEVYQSLSQALEGGIAATSKEGLLNNPILQRKISYDPPAGSMDLIADRERNATE